jgi:hypothetical protein
VALLSQVVRVFYDRLVDPSEQVWMLAALKRLVAAHFKVSFDDLFAHLATDAAITPSTGMPSQMVISTHHLRRCFFGDFMSEPNENGSRPYSEIASPEVVDWHHASVGLSVGICVLLLDGTCAEHVRDGNFFSSTAARQQPKWG